MTDKWQGGKSYVQGALVKPSAVKILATQATNGDFAAGNTGWTFSGSCAFSASGGYSDANCCVAPGSTAGGTALNDAQFVMRAGQTISASCMIQQGASDVDHTRGYVVVLFFDAADAQIGAPVYGNMVNDGRHGAWHPSSVNATAPANTAYAKCGIYLYQNSADPIWGDNLVVNYAYTSTDGLIFKATQAAPGKSGANEPTWPASTGIPVTDNEVTWEGVIATRLVWKASPLFKSGGVEPTWPTDVGAVVRDGTIDWVTVSRRVEDENCPHSKVVAIMASKIFAADGDIIRFSATVNPLDWTSPQDAGYLGSGLQQANANDMAVLAPYRSNLTAMNASSFQNWQVDPDPSAMDLLDQMEGIGSIYQHAAHAVGNELFYLPALGVRSISISAGNDNLSAGDIGMPVDELIQAAMAADVSALGPLATYYPGAGQYWLAFPPARPILGGALPDTCNDATYSQTIAISGGSNPYANPLVYSGAMPAGATLTVLGSTIVVDFVNAAAGDYAFFVTVDGADGATSDPFGVSFRVHDFQITGTLPDTTTDQAYSHDLALIDGIQPYGAVTVINGALPDGATTAIVGDTLTVEWPALTPAGEYAFDLAVTDATGCTAVSSFAFVNAVAACGMSVDYSGGETFPTQFDVVLGASTGTIDLRYFTGEVPDKIEVWFDGIKVIDTGYVGDTSYQSLLDSSLASLGQPSEPIIQRSSTITDLNAGWAAGEWDTGSFEKTTATSYATVKVFAPIAGTSWRLALSCPGGFL